MKIESVCFDMDGTLIRNTDSVRYLCKLNGNLDALEEIEDLENNGEISWIEADHLKAPLIEGLALASVEGEFGRCIDLIQNIALVLTYLKARRISSVLITAGPIQVADILGTELGFDAVYGSRYEVKGKRFTGRITNHLGDGGKLSCLRDFCAKNGIPLEHCVAIGDSESDIEVFTACGKSIAINYSAAAAEAASECIITDDIADILDVFGSWLAE
jgi:phosphoserine phosphatase